MDVLVRGSGSSPRMTDCCLATRFLTSDGLLVCPFVRQLLGYLFADSRLTARSGQRRVLCVWRMAAWLLIHRRTATRSRQRLVCLSAHSEDGCLATQSVVSILLFLDSCSATPSMMAARILNWDSGLSAFSGDNCLAPRLLGGNLRFLTRTRGRALLRWRSDLHIIKMKEKRLYKKIEMRKAKLAKKRQLNQS